MLSDKKTRRVHCYPAELCPGVFLNMQNRRQPVVSAPLFERWADVLRHYEFCGNRKAKEIKYLSKYCFADAEIAAVLARVVVNLSSKQDEQGAERIARCLKKLYAEHSNTEIAVKLQKYYLI